MPVGIYTRTDEARKNMSLSHKGKPHSWWKGVKFSENHRKNLSESHKGQVAWNKGKKLEEDHRLKAIKNLRHDNWLGKKRGPTPINTRIKMSISAKKLVSSGKHHLWKGGIDSINKKIRSSLEYRLWREAVFKRDDWTCVWCKERGGILHSDHIKSFAYFPELRFAIDNGRTLCKKCHSKTDTYGYKAIKKNGSNNN